MERITINKIEKQKEKLQQTLKNHMLMLKYILQEAEVAYAFNSIRRPSLYNRDTQYQNKSK